MDQSQQTSAEQADQSAIDRNVDSFFAAFCNTGGRTPQLDELRGLFLPDAIIVKRSRESVDVMSVDAFIEPRQELLRSGALTEFSEWEQDSQTIIMDGLACRWSTYRKSGFMDGAPYGGAGRKIFSFIRTADGWKIASAIWEDED